MFLQCQKLRITTIELGSMILQCGMMKLSNIIQMCSNLAGSYYRDVTTLTWIVKESSAIIKERDDNDTMTSIIKAPD